MFPCIYIVQPLPQRHHHRLHTYHLLSMEFLDLKMLKLVESFKSKARPVTRKSPCTVNTELVLTLKLCKSRSVHKNLSLHFEE